VEGRSVDDERCTGAAFGNIGVVVDSVPTPAGRETCSYLTCDIQPPSACGP
jgi:hypothetical protein